MEDDEEGWRSQKPGRRGRPVARSSGGGGAPDWTNATDGMLRVRERARALPPAVTAPQYCCYACRRMPLSIAANRLARTPLATAAHAPTHRT